MLIYIEIDSVLNCFQFISISNCKKISMLSLRENSNETELSRSLKIVNRTTHQQKNYSVMFLILMNSKLSFQLILLFSNQLTKLWQGLMDLLFLTMAHIYVTISAHHTLIKPILSNINL